MASEEGPLESSPAVLGAEESPETPIRQHKSIDGVIAVATLAAQPDCLMTLVKQWECETYNLAAWYLHGDQLFQLKKGSRWPSLGTVAWYDCPQIQHAQRHNGTTSDK